MPAPLWKGSTVDRRREFELYGASRVLEMHALGEGCGQCPAPGPDGTREPCKLHAWAGYQLRQHQGNEIPAVGEVWSSALARVVAVRPGAKAADDATAVYADWTLSAREC